MNRLANDSKERLARDERLIVNERELYNANLHLSPHFSVVEFTESATAVQHHIDNTPPRWALNALANLCFYTLEPLRLKLSLPLIITSGYRCPELNSIIAHSSRKSQHTQGQAADFYVGWMPPARGQAQTMEDFDPQQRLKKAFDLIVHDQDIDFDQAILYPRFIHVSYVDSSRNRHSVLYADAAGHYSDVPVM